MLSADFAGLLDCCLASLPGASLCPGAVLALHSLSPLLRQPPLPGAVTLFADVEVRHLQARLCFAEGRGWFSVDLNLLLGLSGPETTLDSNGPWALPSTAAHLCECIRRGGRACAEGWRGESCRLSALLAVCGGKSLHSQPQGLCW